MNIAVTGHRPDKLGYDYDLTSPLIKSIKGRITLILNHFSMGKNEEDRMITGMALGIDTLFALMAIERNQKFIAAIPCRQQYSKWPQKSREIWMDITDHHLCDKYYVSENLYTPHCMNDRNKWMVDKADRIIAVWDGTPGGTANCVEYAKSQYKHIIQLSPN